MKTAFLLMAQRGQGSHSRRASMPGLFLAPARELIQKLTVGEIPIPFVRMEASQKCAKGIYLVVWGEHGR
jgi:hypothetical protein